MPVDLTQLVPALQIKISELLDQCAAAGYPMVPNEGVRDPFAQAKYWRQARTTEKINAEIANLKAQGAPFLAYCLESVGPQNGDLVTNAIPGLSWHQWGEALDCYWSVDGNPVWSTTETVDGKNGFLVYANLAKGIGLTPGGYFTSIKDWPHVQLRSAGSPLGLYTLQQIDVEMESRFGNGSLG